MDGWKDAMFRSNSPNQNIYMQHKNQCTQHNRLSATCTLNSLKKTVFRTSADFDEMDEKNDVSNRL